MARDKISEYDATDSNNTVVADINIAEGCPPSGINNAIRAVMGALKRFQTGADSDPVTIGGAAVLSSTLNVTGATTIGGAAVLSSTSSFAGTANFQDNSVQRPTLLDYCVKGSALGTVGTLATVDMENGNFFSATLGSATTFAFSNPCTTGNFGGFIMELTNGGSATVTWPAAVDFPGGTAPTLTASGTDLLVFVTRDAGTTYHGMAASLDSKTPA